jgi:hypothetical protein
MIVGTLTLIILLLGSGAGFSFDMYKKAAEDVIQDKQIVRQIKSVTKAADKEMDTWQKDAKKISKQFAEMNRNYDLTKAEMNTFINQADSRRDEFQEKLIQLRFQAKNLMSQEEWEAMYAKTE